jgi:hypothetical protein
MVIYSSDADATAGGLVLPASFLFACMTSTCQLPLQKNFLQINNKAESNNNNNDDDNDNNNNNNNNNNNDNNNNNNNNNNSLTVLQPDITRTFQLLSKADQVCQVALP